MKELLGDILYDDGRAGPNFKKNKVIIKQDIINELKLQDVRINSKNLRAMKNGLVPVKTFPDTILSIN